MGSPLRTFITAFFVVPVILLSFNPAQAQTITSVADGDFGSAGTWDCNCVPTFNDDVTVQHTIEVSGSATIHNLTISTGDSLIVNSGLLKVLGSVTIQEGGYLENNSPVIVSEDYSNSGEHYLRYKCTLTGNEVNIDGTGILTGAKKFILQGGAKTVVSGAVLNKVSGQISLTDGAQLQNSGTVSSGQIEGTSGTGVVNNTGGFLNLRGTFDTSNGMTLEANSFNNTVIFGREGLINQELVTPINGRFFDLVIGGNNDNAVKELTGDIEVLGNLTIDSVTFDAGTPVAYNIKLKGNWNNAAGEFNPRDRTVTLNGGNQTLSAPGDSVTFNALIVNASSDVTFEDPLKVSGNLLNNGTLVGDNTNHPSLFLKNKVTGSGLLTMEGGTVTFSGSSTQYVSGDLDFYNVQISNTVGVEITSGNMKVKNGLTTLPSGVLQTNGNLTLVSNAEGTAYVGPIFSGNIVGDVVVERYHYTPVNGYVHLCSPVSGQTFADWDDDLLTTGFTGSDYPNYFFNNIRLYDETQSGFEDNGLYGASNVTDPIEDGVGYQFYLAAGTMNVSVKGPLYIGDMTLPTSFTDSGSPEDDGWNLVANPYASTINWDVGPWTKTNLNDAIYVWDATQGQYTSYINGVSANGGSKYVASSQSFWVQANAADPELVAREGIKSTVTGSFKDAGAEEEEVVPVFRMKLSGYDFLDETVLRVNENASGNYDSHFDAYKLSGSDGAPNISTVSADGYELSINAISKFEGQTLVPVKMTVDQPGDYQVEIIDPANLGSGVCAVLEDRFTEEQYPLSNGDDLTFTLSDTTQIARFALRLNRVATVEPAAVTCHGSADGALEVSAAAGGVNYLLFNAEDELVESISGVSGQFAFNGLSGGDYTVEVQDENSACGVIQMPVTIEEPEPLQIDYTATDPTCAGDVDGELAVTILGGSQPYSMTVNGNEYASLSGMPAGTYHINVEDARGCVLDSAVSLTPQTEVNAAFSAPPEVDMQDGEAPVSFGNNSVNGESYSWNFGEGGTSTVENPVHTYTQPGNYEVALTAFNGPCNSESTHWVSVSNTSGLQEQSSLGDFSLYGNAHNIVFEYHLDNPTDIDYSLYDITGKLINSEHVDNLQAGITTFSKPDAAGIYLAEISSQGRVVTVQRVSVK